MSEPGLEVHRGADGSRMEMACPHRSGVLYAVPAEATWVCSGDLLHAHALTGFLTELVAMEDPRVRDLMQRWGLYFRERPIEPPAVEAPG